MVGNERRGLESELVVLPRCAVTKTWTSRARRTISADALRPNWPLLFLGFLCALCNTTPGTAAQASTDLVTDLPFDATNEFGVAAPLSQWRGRTFLLTMAYSSCRQVCSYTLHRLEELQASADRAGTPIEVVVISYDPATDGPHSWLSYRQRHHISRATWHFLTGSSAGTAELANLLNFPHWLYDDHVVHDFRILEIGADGHIAQTLTWANRRFDPFAAASVNCSTRDSQGCLQ